MTAEPRRSAISARLPRPTRSAALLLLLAVILELLGQLIKSTGVTIAAAAALGAIIGDAALAPRIDGFTITRDIAERLTAGITSTFRLTIETPANRRGHRRSVVLRHEHPGLSTGRVVTPSLPAGGTAVAMVTTEPLHRGYWTDGGYVEIEAFSPLGGFVRRHRIALDGELWVHPAPATSLRLPDSRQGFVHGQTPAARAGSGNDFFGIREWRVGDSSTAVHWRASARRNQLVVMERERPTHAGLLILCGKPAEDEIWEPVVARTAATAVAALRGGRALAIVNNDTIIHPTSAQEVLDFFAAMTHHTTTPSTTVATAAKSVGSGATWVWLAAQQPPVQTVRRQFRSPLVAPLGGGDA